MELEKFNQIVFRLKEGQLIEIVRLDPSGRGFFVDEVTGEKKPIRQPYYFSSGTKISLNEPGISVTSNKNHLTGRLEPSYGSISYKEIEDIIPVQQTL